MTTNKFDRIAKAKEVIAALPQSNFPTGKQYRLIVADPPWQFDLRNADVSHRNRCAYPSMSAGALEDLPVDKVACKDAYLLLWFTVQHTEQAFLLARTWGFAPATFHTWVKTCKSDPAKLRLGVGHYGRGGTEHYLVAKRGNPGSWSGMGITDIPGTLIAPWTGKHSEKPEKFWAIANRLKDSLAAKHGDCPAIELFARQPREGWTCWGNEVGEEAIAS